ncbi:hypothetical protein Pmar_PMAR020782 [Perkinsus marinus ATCC 50983]|uniref:SAP domain-containing protein n=1 Tax=Perkinsus marinus (strain ATCC 50983 / TXsc) TaxID=423536 RepID=C5KQU5_PERM5|nr:hypothetical protein Pmar_PMAR020782 [Perkinsus marinus ATCC 50983]EER13191.1 hypothetical protein Pmar_PMAR020782 [Perkinsus marinus ATCC 50983]|eukprot:XP_002781396.1 hypothetical protein Pmar_PMAR020782 [Perkinsus marinus ATCC 50983]
MTEIREGLSEISLSSGSDIEINKKGGSKPKEREAHVAAGEALRSACQLVMDDLVRRGQTQVHDSSPGLGQQSHQTACYLDDEEYVLLKGVKELSLIALRRLAGLAGRRWPKWHPTDGLGDEELFQRGYIYHTCLSPAEQVLTYEEPKALRGFETIACSVEVPQLGGGPLMPNLLQSLDTNALRRLAATLALPSAGTKASLLKSIRTEFSGRQRTLHRSVLDMSMVLKALRESAYVRLTVVTVEICRPIECYLPIGHHAQALVLAQQ